MGLRPVYCLLLMGSFLLSACSNRGESAYPIPKIAIQTVEVMVQGTPVSDSLRIPNMSGYTGPVATQASILNTTLLSYPPPHAASFSQQDLAGSQMVIKDAQLELLVDDINLAIEQVTQEVKDQGGYILSSQIWNRADSQRAELRLNVPSEKFEQTLNYLRNLGVKVLSETASGSDITAEYTDLESRLANLEATAARVRQFLDDARTVEDALRINTELSNLEGQIEQIKGTMRYYENRAEFSSIYVLLSIDLPTPTPTATPAWSPGLTAQNAADAMILIWQTIVDVLIWILIIGWPLAILALILWLILRRRKRRLQHRESESSQSS
jgi:hypothetical protein